MNSDDFLTRISRFQVVLGAVATLFGAIGFYLARNIAFTTSVGIGSGFADYEIRLMTFNRLGALVLAGVGVIGLVAGLARLPALGFVAGLGALLMALQVVVQWRSDPTANIFGAGGQNLSFDLLLAIGFGVTTYLARFAGTVATHADSV